MSAREIIALILGGLTFVAFLVIVFANFGDVPRWWTKWREKRKGL